MGVHASGYGGLAALPLKIVKIKMRESRATGKIIGVSLGNQLRGKVCRSRVTSKAPKRKGERVPTSPLATVPATLLAAGRHPCRRRRRRRQLLAVHLGVAWTSLRTVCFAEEPQPLVPRGRCHPLASRHEAPARRSPPRGPHLRRSAGTKAPRHVEHSRCAVVLNDEHGRAGLQASLPTWRPSQVLRELHGAGEPALSRSSTRNFRCPRARQLRSARSRR